MREKGFLLKGKGEGRFFEHWEVARAMEEGDLEKEAFLREKLRGACVSQKDLVLVSAASFENEISLEYYDLVFNTMLKGDSYSANIRMGVFQNDVTPTSSLTIDNFRSTLGEFTQYTVDGGNVTNRSTVQFSASSGQKINNEATPSRFTFTGSGTIRGLFIVQGATLKDGTQDADPAVYVAGGRLSNDYPVSNGTILDLTYEQYKP